MQFCKGLAIELNTQSGCISDFIIPFFNRQLATDNDFILLPGIVRVQGISEVWDCGS